MRCRGDLVSPGLQTMLDIRLRTKSQELQATSQELRTKSQELRTKSQELRTKNQELRAKKTRITSHELISSFVYRSTFFIDNRFIKLVVL